MRRTGHRIQYIDSMESPYGSTCSTHQVKAILLFYLQYALQRAPSTAFILSLLFDTLDREPPLLSVYHPFDPDPVHSREPTLHPPTVYHTSSLPALVVPSSRTDPHTGGAFEPRSRPYNHLR
ncbi:hypothetical protein EJ02DRAFT_479468 [Clathrospora elynae]|uniref:Uncharacterized protein n=1 Tax=Clathrospora elynae TaxID=706981 RepID=A0A6A5SWU3_9PLEO|nr:hypothetical protein EJ02DRAFT_479468 [Clathrospora elynae]